jgi:hypothetical protein
VELLHGGVRGAELENREQSSPKHALSVMPGPQSRHDGPTRHDTKRPSGLIGSGRVGPSFFGLVPGSGRAARLEFYM